uniref:Uncharacterized protein n=1 Tax=Picocystis salinarum TaxID=88271 RepID=A0A7S3UBQ0_9CHLO|mmetsp:Transcript_3483/g.12373  ORF Transcript_3483/g.12373 Transcript_3483/m.12373 type:complete len:102 (+) Transcript_3483:211-516(+)
MVVTGPSTSECVAKVRPSETQYQETTDDMLVEKPKHLYKRTFMIVSRTPIANIMASTEKASKKDGHSQFPEHKFATRPICTTNVVGPSRTLPPTFFRRASS